MERHMGLFKEVKSMSTAAQAELRTRKREAGRQIHLKNVEDSTNRASEMEAENIAKQIQSLMADGRTEEEANAFVEKNLSLAEARAEKLAARRERQEAKYNK